MYIRYGKYCKSTRKEIKKINSKRIFGIILILILSIILFSKKSFCSNNFYSNFLYEDSTLNQNPTKNLTLNNENTIADVSENWNTLQDNELNEIIANSSQEELSDFLQELNEEETEEILERDTMLNNTINHYEPENTEEEISDQILVNSEPYYQYLINSESTYSTNAKSTSKKLTSKKGNFFIQISGDGKTTKRLIEVELSSTDVSKEQTVKFSEVAVLGYDDNHNFKITTATSKTKTTDNYYTILTMEFSYTKPAHYTAYGDYSDKVDGYRFNFRKYTADNSGSSTVNNTGHNVSDTTEVIDLQINVANCGINQSSNQYTASSATGYIKLKKNYYSSLQINPNGGTHNGNISTYIYGTKACGTTISIADPTREGYQFSGWTLSKGSNCTGASFDASTKNFIYCGNSASNSNISDSNICVLYANWQKIYGTITVKPIDEYKNWLKNAKYSVYDSSGNLIQTLETGNNSEGKFTNLPVGEYTIYEEKIEEGYELTKTNGMKVNITESNTNIILEIIHYQKMILPEAGGIYQQNKYIFVGSILVLNKILNKRKRGINE